jgi:hypothetical protein
VPTDSDHAKRWKITWNPDPQHAARAQRRTATRTRCRSPRRRTRTGSARR